MRNPFEAPMMVATTHTPAPRRVAFSAEVLDLWAMVAESGHVEVCGPIAGIILPDGTVVITHTSGPGEHGARQVAFSNYDTNALQGWIDCERSLRPWLVLFGILHIHPGRSWFSSTDEQSMRLWVLDPDFQLEHAIFPIVGRDAAGHVSEMTVWAVSRNDPRPVALEWSRLEAGDPMLEAARVGLALEPLPIAELQEPLWQEVETTTLQVAEWVGPQAPAGLPEAAVPMVALAADAATAPPRFEPVERLHDEFLERLEWGLTMRGFGLEVVESKGHGAHWRVMAGRRPALCCVPNAERTQFQVFAGGEVTPKALLHAGETVVGGPEQLARALAALATRASARAAARFRARVHGPVPLEVRSTSSTRRATAVYADGCGWPGEPPAPAPMR